MAKISFKIAYPIIIAGFFIMVAFVALNYQNLNSSFYIVFALLAIYIFLFGFATGKNFAQPIKKLLKRANDLSEGDLKSRFYLENKDELGELATVFNKIADELEQSHTKIEDSEKSVGIKVEAKTQELGEVINALERKVQNRTLELSSMVRDLQKFKEESKAKELEVIELRSQVMELKSRLEKRTSRKNKASDGIEPEVVNKVNVKTQALKKTISDLEERMKNRTLEFQKVAGNLEKFQEYSKAKENEILKLENQINDLIQKPETDEEEDEKEPEE